MNTVEMAHGSGGQAMQQLINRLFMEAFNLSLIHISEPTRPY